jgi:hypothetical protein
MDLNELNLLQKIRLLKNPNTSPEILARLAEDRDWFVRYNVAQDPNTTPEILVHLAEDKCEDVRWNVTNNPNTPQYAKEYLNAMNFMEYYRL